MLSSFIRSGRGREEKSSLFPVLRPRRKALAIFTVLPIRNEDRSSMADLVSRRDDSDKPNSITLLDLSRVIVEAEGPQEGCQERGLIRGTNRSGHC